MKIAKLSNGLIELSVAILSVVLFTTLLLAITRLTDSVQVTAAPQTVTAEFKGRFKNSLQLTPYKAQKEGPQYKQLPRTLEEKKSAYSKLYGRQLLKERQTRYISQWNSPETKLTWTVDIAVSGGY